MRGYPVLPVLLKDGYKVGHKFQYPKNTTKVSSNLTPRASRIPSITKIVSFGFQAFVIKWLQRYYDAFFFSQPKELAVARYKRRIDNYLGKDTVDVSHIGELWELGYLPIEVKAIPEGTLVPLRVPMFTITNTVPKFFWLTNMLETLISCETWQPMTNATVALEYRKVFERWAEITGAPKEFIDWQGHDFSMRGMAGVDAATISGAAHLLSFTGTDTIPAIDFLEDFYDADSDKELIAGSVPATEHSVMCMGMKEGEFETFKRLITEVYPSGFISIVADTWDFWQVITDYIPRLKNEILARDGRVVIRPDSGDPVKIIVGAFHGATDAERRGAIGCLWDIFGGKINEKGYKELDPHIGLIYGDSINLERQEQILAGLALKGFASSNVVLGIGSYTYQYNTRDTFGFAIKATYGELDGVGQAISKDPKTDDGVKKSASGLLRVEDENGTLVCYENQTLAQEKQGLLQTIFKDGKIYNKTTLSEIRTRLKSQR